MLLVLTSNRGLAGAYNGNVLRVGQQPAAGQPDRGDRDDRWRWRASGGSTTSGSAAVPVEATYTQFEDRPQYEEVEALAEKYIKLYVQGVDRPARRGLYAVRLVVEAGRDGADPPADHDGRHRPGGRSVRKSKPAAAESAAPVRKAERVPYEFLPDPRSILEEIVPVSFKVRLFKCFLDAAVSEQIARMVAMGGATKNANDLVKSLTRQYNRARQSQITRELADIVGAAAALQ